MRLNKIKDAISDMYCMGYEEELVKENGVYQYILMSKQKTLIISKTLYR